MRKLFLAGMLVAAGVACADDDPPSRVARLNFVDGSVSFQAAGHDDWSEAVVNYPLTTGDRLWADENSHAELHIASTAIRLDSHTAVAFLNLDDRMTQVRLSDGTINITVRHLGDDDSYEIDTPNGAVTLLRPGRYRIDADPDRETTTVTVRGGEAEVTSAGQAFPVHARQSAFVTGSDNPTTEVRAAISTDNFDRWWETRDDREDRRPPPRYVSRDMVGYEDLDEYGYWRDEPGYGQVWVPRTVAAGWAPYRYGHWAWVDPWGWTWIDDAPWGFAPFHYGRWAYAGGGWCWIPGPVAVRPVYAPALVAWVGGEHFGVAIGFGGGGGVGWLPLGPREIYRPSYRVSETYVNRVNVTNITNITNVNVTNVNVNNVRYVNQNAPGAVTAVSRTDFAQSRPVARVAVRVPPSAIASAQVTTQATPIPRAQAIAARPAAPVAVARPPQTVVNTPVVTKTPPPPATRTLARPANPPIYRPAAPNQPAQAARPGQPTPVYQPPAAQPRPQSTDRPPAAQPRPQEQPAYRPPAAQERPQVERTDRPPAAQPRPQEQPAYRPPAAQERPQVERTDRPPAAQPRPQEQPAYRPPAAQERPQAEPQRRPPQSEQPAYRPAPQNRPAPEEARPHNHPDRPPEAQRRPQNEERRAPERRPSDKDMKDK